MCHPLDCRPIRPILPSFPPERAVMESVWYYAREGAQTGPVSFDELKKVVGAGQIGPEDLVWKEGTPDWMPAKTIPGLFATPAPSPPPAAAAPPAPAPLLPS